MPALGIHNGPTHSVLYLAALPHCVQGMLVCAGAMQYFGIKEEDTPALAIHDAATNSKYLQANASPEDVMEFITQFEVSQSFPVA